MSLTFSPQSLVVGLRELFLRASEGIETNIPELCNVEQSDKLSETYLHLGQSPRMREFIGERQLQAITDAGFTVVNKEYEATLGVKVAHLEDGQTASLRTRIAELATEAPEHAESLVHDLLPNGTDSTIGLCYDGVPFFSASHPARNKEGGAQSNLLSGSGADTVAHIKTDFAAAMGALRGLKDETGRPFHRRVQTGVGQLTVVCPTELEFMFLEVLNAVVISNTTNVYAGKAKLIVSPYLTDASDWYLLHTGAPVKPFIFQERKAVQFESQEAGSDSDFNRKEWQYGVYARYAASYALWQNAIKVNNS